MKNSKIISAVLTFVVLALPTLAMAGGPGFGGGVNDGGGGCAAPLDGGLSLLIVAGISYGSKKLADKRNKANEMSDL